MKTAAIVKNWVEGTTPDILENIHQDNVNITMYNRNIDGLKKEINSLLKQDISSDLSGNVDTILNELKKVNELKKHNTIVQDIQNLLCLFKEITNAKGFRLLLATIDTNMCRKFHTDINDLRMLCTYSGSGTLWLTDDNVNRKALTTYQDNQSIVIDKNRIEQAKTGAIIVLKGAKYPKEVTKAVVHRSPTIEDSGEKRLLLRIDTN